MFSPSELRHAYYSDAVVFAATSNCLALHWEGTTKLVVACNGTTIDPRYIDVQKQQSNGVAIAYESIPIK